MRRSLPAFLRHLMATTLLLGNLPAHAAGGVDGVEFRPIPVNINNQCSSTILKGTNAYRGYAFKMPRVMLGVDTNFEDLFEIIPKGNGQYTLRFGLFFPMKDEALEIRRERSTLQVNYCNDDVVIAELNEAGTRQNERDNTKTADGKKAPPRSNEGTVYEEKIQAISPLPVSAVEVSIDGFSMTKLIGNPDGNILEYPNNTLIAEFTIPDEATYEELKAHLTGRIGLSVNLKFSFAARSGNGRADVHLDTRNLADSLEAALSGALGVGDATLGTRVIGETDLRAYMAKAIAKTAVNISTEEGDNEAITRLANQLVERIAAQIPGLPQTPGAQWNANSCINNPLGPNCNGQNGSTWPTWPSGTGTGGTFPDPNNTGNGTFNSPPPPAAGPPGPILNHDKRDPNLQYFNVGAVLNRIRQQQDIRLTFQNLGKRETQTYTTKEIIRGEPPAPGFRMFNVTAGDKKGETYTNFIKKGHEVTIKLPSSRENVTSFEKRIQYFSRDAIRRQGIANNFNMIQEALQKNQLLENIDQQNGGYVATYKLNDGVGSTKRFFKEWYYGTDLTPWNITWGSVELRRRTLMGEPTDLDLNDAEALAKVPLKVVFSELGRRYDIAQLAKDYPQLWNARFEDGEIILTALRDLGYMNFRNYATVVAPNRRAEKYIFERREMAEIPKVGSDAATKSMDQRRVWSWLKYTGDSGSGVESVKDPSEDLKPFSFTKSVYVVMVKFTTGAAAEQPATNLWPTPSAPVETPAPVVPAPLADKGRQKKSAATAKNRNGKKAAATAASPAQQPAPGAQLFGPFLPATPAKPEVKTEVKTDAKPAATEKAQTVSSTKAGGASEETED